MCFLRLEGFTSEFPLPSSLSRPGISPDQVNFVLVRWFSPHPEAVERDELHRPLCPGPLGINHCSWVWSKTTRPRSCITNERIWSSWEGIRNTVPEEVRVKRQDLMHASYEFQEICHIDAYVSMNSLYQWNAEAKTWSKSVNTFLETVVIP